MLKNRRTSNRLTQGSVSAQGTAPSVEGVSKTPASSLSTSINSDDIASIKAELLNLNKLMTTSTFTINKIDENSTKSFELLSKMNAKNPK